MAGANVKVLLILSLAVVQILPAWGNQSDDVIAQLQLEMQTMSQRLERFGKDKFFRSPVDQPTQLGQTSVGGVN